MNLQRLCCCKSLRDETLATFSYVEHFCVATDNVFIFQITLQGIGLWGEVRKLV